jgi:C1A family cysteine protease
MAHFLPRGFGWLASAPDFRDFAPQSPQVTEWLRLLGGMDQETAAASSADLREYFLEVDDQLELDASPAHACIGLVQYFERRAHGRLLRPARLFLHQNALRFSGATGVRGGVDLRTTLQAMVRCGIPPERFWPYEPQRCNELPDAFLYSFDEPYRGIRYVRLDGRNSTGRETLHRVKAFLAAGFPACFGCMVPSTLTADGQIPYRPTFDSPLGGQALVAVGYDDRWLRGSRGALLVRSSWGASWGESGYGWLPYAFVEEQLAVDFYTLLHPDWIGSGEFDAPF